MHFARNKKLDVWLIQTGEPLPLGRNISNMRTAVLAEKLIGRGHNVFWWASAFDHFKKKWMFKEDSEIIINQNFKILALKGLGYKKNISLSRIIDHRVVARKFKKLAQDKPKPDIIVASTPPHDLAWEAVRYAKQNGIPILIDIRDPWPEIFLKHVPAALHKLFKTLFYRDFIMVEKTMRAADGLIAVTNTLLEWGLHYAKRDKTSRDKIYYLGYKKQNISDDSEIINKFSRIRGVLQNKFIVFFVGTLSKSYHNPLILLKAAEKLKEIENIHFIISGDGELFEDLKRDSVGLENVTLTGWLNQHEIKFFLQHSKIGVCPSINVIDLPTNKAFAYASSGLPIISSFHGDLKDIIENNNIGFFYPHNNLDAFISCIIKLYSDSNLYKRMSENAKRVFDEMFDADKIYTDYVEHIENTVRDFGTRR